MLASISSSLCLKFSVEETTIQKPSTYWLINLLLYTAKKNKTEKQTSWKAKRLKSKFESFIEGYSAHL